MIFNTKTTKSNDFIDYNAFLVTVPILKDELPQLN